MTVRRSLVVVLHDGDGHVGYGESPPFELPFYSEETLGSARLLLAELLIPRLLGRELEGPEAVDALLREGVRGNPFARAALETAAWDLEAHRRGTRARRAARRAAGRQAGGADLVRRRPRHPGRPFDGDAPPLDRGGAGARLSPGEDQSRARLGRRAGRGGARRARPAPASRSPWTRTAATSGRSTRPPCARSTRPSLLYIEQPLAPDELVGHARLTQTLRTPVCVDETLHEPGGAPARGARRTEGLEREGAPDGRAHRGVPRRPARARGGHPPLGGDHAGVRPRPRRRRWWCCRHSFRLVLLRSSRPCRPSAPT